MNYVFQAVYENGVLRPLEKLNLGEHQQVLVTVAPDIASESGPQQAIGDPLNGVRATTGIADLAEHFDDYRFGRRNP